MIFLRKPLSVKRFKSLFKMDKKTIKKFSWFCLIAGTICLICWNVH